MAFAVLGNEASIVKARLLLDTKEPVGDDLIVQMRVWRLPTRTAERPHGLKYSFFFGRPDERIIDYDNERGKGDHRHYRHREEAYVFVDIETLIGDFRRDVAREMNRE